MIKLIFMGTLGLFCYGLKGIAWKVTNTKFWLLWLARSSSRSKKKLEWRQWKKWLLSYGCAKFISRSSYSVQKGGYYMKSRCWRNCNWQSIWTVPSKLLCKAWTAVNAHASSFQTSWWRPNSLCFWFKVMRKYYVIIMEMVMRWMQEIDFPPKYSNHWWG